MKSETLFLDNQLCHRFYVVSNALTRAYRPMLEALDLTYPQYIVMMSLWQKDQVTVKELLQHTQIDGGAMTLMLKKLEKKLIVNITPSEEDKRVKLISLTEKGQALQQKALKLRESVLCQFAPISEQELLQLTELVDKLKNNLTD